METEIQSTQSEASSAPVSTPTESTTTSTPSEAPSTGSSSPVVSSSNEAAASTPMVDGKPIAAAPWTPNYKYKALDKEHEIEEEYRAYIKNQDDEKKIKRLFEQKAGVDGLKAERNTLREEVQTVKQKAQAYDAGFTEFNQLAAKGEFKKAFEQFNVPKDMILKAAKQILDFDELPQHQQQMHTQLQEQERHNAMLSAQHNQVLSQMNQFKTQVLQSELTTVLGRQDVKAISQKYDEAYGPGKFFELVKTRGQQLSKFSGQDPTATQVVEELLQMYKPMMSQSAIQPQAQAQNLPVIPATGSASTQAPGEKSIRNMDDLIRARESKRSSRR